MGCICSHAEMAFLFMIMKIFFMKDLYNETTENKNRMLHGTYDRR